MAIRFLRSIKIALAIQLSIAPAAMATPEAPRDPGIWIEGGLTDCGEWVAGRRSNRASNLEHYSVGVLNGMSLGEAKDFWRAGASSSVSKEAVYLWLDNYCTANPLEKLTTGIVKLFRERTEGKR